MGRPKRGAAAVPKPKTIGEQVEQTARLNQLTDREKALAMQSKARKQLKLPAKLDEYEQILAWCEQWDEDLPTIVRACFLVGLEHYRNFASSGAPYSPFAAASFVPRSPGQVDPSGRAFPPPPVQTGFVQPAQTQAPVTHSGMNFRPPAPRETVTETVEPVFGDREGMVQVGRKRIPTSAVLPSGATDDIAPAQQQEPPAPIGPELGAAIAQTLAEMQVADGVQPQMQTFETVALTFEKTQEPVPTDDADPLAGGATQQSDLEGVEIEDLL